jgi:TolA-binding protein
MQAQDATTAYLFKLWPWLEANAKRILSFAAFVVIVTLLFSFYSWRQSQKEIEASQALTQVIVSGGDSQPADAYLKIPTDYTGTRAAGRAQLLGAVSLFISGKYADAQAQFQKFLNTYPDNSFAPQAALGVAASLESQGKIDLASDAYQKAINQTTDASVIVAAKFALARIDERQGKISDAQNFYEEVIQAYPNSPMSSEAELRLMELKMKSPAISTPHETAPASAIPFNLGS